MKAIKINPKFEDLNGSTSTEIFAHVEGIKKESKLKQNIFPVEIFPKEIQEVITETNQSLNFPIDFIGASILYVASVAIGNTHKVEIKKGWQESPVLYLSIVGRAGTNKSHPVSFALQPIENMDRSNFQKYQIKKQEYDSILSLSKKEREQQGYNEPVKPIWEQHLITDFTPEALADVHKFNKRGLGVYTDELATWFKNFNRYNKGSEEQFWLTVWSGKAIRINRKTTEPTLIAKPFISVIGTIQPKVLKELADNRTENGFLDRILFVVPEDLKKPYWNETEIKPEVLTNYHTIISNLLGLSLIQDETNTPKPEVLEFTPEAKQILFNWQRELTDQSNDPENEALAGINAKLEVYAVRLALILQMILYACDKDTKHSIGTKALQGAIKLVDYFKTTAKKVHSTVNSVNPLDRLPIDKQTLYDNLPETFTTSEGTQVAENLGIPDRTFRHFIQNRELFNKPKRGEYEKLL